MSYYEKLIMERVDWQLAKIYAERVSGTQLKKRTEFVKMIKTCKAGKINLIFNQVDKPLWKKYA